MAGIVLILLFQVIFVHSFGKNLSPDESLKEDILLNTLDFIIKYGNKAELYNVTTTDGYILQIHHMIPRHGRPARKHPIFIMHGLASSSFDWLILGPGKSLPHLLSAEGYDIWFGNARGNLYSSKHLHLNHNSSKFWNFSWHEIGIYDLTASIDHVLNITRSESLHYIGHSQGTTAFFVMCSMIPDYNRKIQTMNALSPVVFMSNVSPDTKRLATFAPLVDATAHFAGVHQIPKIPQKLRELGHKICSETSNISELCDNVFFLMFGYDTTLWNKTLVPLFLSHSPAEISTKQLVHYAQEIMSGKFRQFDYSIQNKLMYGRGEPPDYPLDRVTAPVALHWSDGDPLSSPADVHELSTKICNVALSRKVPFANFSHTDYMWAIDAKKYLYDAVIQVISEHDDSYVELKNK